MAGRQGGATEAGEIENCFNKLGVNAMNLQIAASKKALIHLTICHYLRNLLQDFVPDFFASWTLSWLLPALPTRQ
jgi:hypothetical protein